MNQVTTAFREATGEREVVVESNQSARFLPAEIAGHRCRETFPTQADSEWHIRRILVPTDYSEAFAGVIRRAVAIARQCRAALTVLHVVDINAASESGPAESLMKRLWDESSSQMAHLACSLAGQVDAQTMLVEGLPSDVIIEKSSEFDLMVIGKSRGTRRWNPFGKHTARRVIENAVCPVVVV